MVSIFLFPFGLIAGSFIAALSYRFPREISIKKGRSLCPNCKKTISWFDNLPLLSYVLLGGKCRKCDKKISVRYPLIEGLTGILFLLIGPNIFLLFATTLLMALLVIDWENMLLPDEFIFWGLAVAVFYLLFSSQAVYLNLLAGFAAALFFLGIFFITLGRGMGLGDVKLALLIGVILGMKLILPWLLISFISGGIVATALLLSKKAKLKEKIAFGPFLIFGFFVVSIVGDKLLYLF